MTSLLCAHVMYFMQRHDQRVQIENIILSSLVDTHTQRAEVIVSVEQSSMAVPFF